jgi:hydrogenase maturation protein HypF
VIAWHRACNRPCERITGMQSLITRMHTVMAKARAGTPTTSPASWLAAEIDLPLAAPSPWMAVGAESKGAFCIADGARAFVSRSFGSLLEPDNYRRYRAALARAQDHLAIVPERLACDMHPGYLSTVHATTSGKPVFSVQHHHAHIAACLAEHGRCEPVIGIVCDGAGCGADKASWGCEVLRVEPASFDRLAHLKYFQLPGSDKSALQCWRPAYSLCRDAFGGALPADIKKRHFAAVPTRDLTMAERILQSGFQSPATSSLGRLFDVVAYLLGLCRENEHEAQAAIALETAAGGKQGSPLPFELDTSGHLTILDMAPAMRALIERRSSGVNATQLAADFHETIAMALAGIAIKEAARHDLDTVALSGGCLANKLLTRDLTARLRGAALDVLNHRVVSCGDAGVPLGQAFVAAATEAAERESE